MDSISKYKESRSRLFQLAGVNPQSKFVTTQGPVKKVHYLEMGLGQPLVMVHGGGSHSSEWYNILGPLAKRYHLYVVDRPGCGLTDAIDYKGVDYQKSAVNFIASFLDALGLEHVILIGQSMGGYFSICFALQQPDRVEKLLLIGAPAGMNRWIPPMLRLLGTKWINRILVNTVGKPSIKNAKGVHKQLLIFDVDKLPEVYLAHSYHNLLLPGSEKGFLSMLENVVTLRGWNRELYIGDQLDQLKMPVRFIWGDHDVFEKPDSGIAKTLTIQDCKFEVVENAGHSPWLDQPEICSSLIDRMLAD